MTDEKICPFMSKNKISYINEDGGEEVEFAPVYCLKERCMAWGKKLERRESLEDPVVWVDGCRLIP